MTVSYWKHALIGIEPKDSMRSISLGDSLQKTGRGGSLLSLKQRHAFTFETRFRVWTQSAAILLLTKQPAFGKFHAKLY